MCVCECVCVVCVCVSVFVYSCMCLCNRIYKSTHVDFGVIIADSSIYVAS